MKKVWFTVHIIASIAFAHHFYLHVTGAETNAVIVAFGLAFGVFVCIHAANEEIKK